MAIKVTTENNPVILATAGKFCQENIQVEFTETSGGGDAQAMLDSLIEGTATNIETKAKSVGAYSFYKNASLVSIDMPFVTSIGEQAFRDCIKLALTELPEGLTSIGNYAFRDCINLALTELPKGLTSIGGNAFSGCANLALTELPAGITSIGGSAFSNCSGLTSITFKGKPVAIYANIFNGCTNLTTINVPWAEGAVANAPWGATNATINYNYVGEG